MLLQTEILPNLSTLLPQAATQSGLLMESSQFRKVPTLPLTILLGLILLKVQIIVGNQIQFAEVTV
jgi:hypothetical protein